MEKHFYLRAAKVRRALGSNLFPEGTYHPREIIESLIKNNVVLPWEATGQMVRDQLKNHPKWAYVGGSSMLSTWERKSDKPKAAVKPVEVITAAPDEPERGPVTQRLARIEMMLDLLCANLGIPTQVVGK